MKFRDGTGGAGGAVSPMNDAKILKSPFAPMVGLPNLGPIEPGKPAKAFGFFKNIEIEASIEPCVKLPNCKFDFYRTKQGFQGLIDSAGKATSFEIQDNSVALPDDSHNADEDLEFGNDCKLYVIDTPGFIAMGNCLGAEYRKPNNAAFIIKAGDILYTALNFRESLNVDGNRCSKDLDWRASTVIICADPISKKWRAHTIPGFSSQSVGDGHFPPATFDCPEGAAGGDGGRRALGTGHLGDAQIDIAWNTLLDKEESQLMLLEGPIMIQGFSVTKMKTPAEYCCVS